MSFNGHIACQFGQGSLTVEDGTSVTPLSCTVRYDNADFSISGLAPNLREVTAYEGRGDLRSLRQTSRSYPTISLSAQVTDLTEASTGSVADMILGNGAHSARISTTEAIGDVLTFDVTFTASMTSDGADNDISFVCEDVHLVLDFSQGDPDTISLTGTVYGAITGDLAQSEG